ncbi:DUF1761 domain-containing protein [Allorhizocola rhizosphaerae]|uniref:DUF1761 domain-containing protein n=1 Tax=Allorhizocola rhizosphaerae TaxID=1872709 RepID=UPI000E3DBF0D|nr:DUF1761 domain-containing protein [Allorhizocola rhizosphaerae]
MKVLAGFNEINYLAVIVAAIAGFGIGAVWYAPPVFGSTWQRLTGRTGGKGLPRDPATLRGASPKPPDGSSVLPTMITAFAVTVAGVLALALFIGRDAGVGPGLAAGLAAGVGIATVAILINGIFEARSPVLMAINSGYQIVLFAVAGAILGAW